MPRGQGAPLTDEVRAKVLEMHAEGMTRKAQAKEMGVSPDTISRWWREMGLKGRSGPDPREEGDEPETPYKNPMGKPSSCEIPGHEDRMAEYIRRARLGLPFPLFGKDPLDEEVA